MNTLYAGQITYFDWHFTNSGSVTASGSFHVELRIDGVWRVRYPYSNWDAGWTGGFDDWGFDVSTPGWHTVSLVTDPDSTITESDETNNTWEMQFYWVGATETPTSTRTPPGGPTATSTRTPTATRTPGPQDTTAPTVNWIGPVRDEQVYTCHDGDLVWLEAVATDNVAVQRVRFFRWDAVNEVTVDIGDDYTPPYQASIGCSVLNFDWNQTNVEAFDTAGNSSGGKYIWISRDRPGTSSFALYLPVILSERAD